MTWMGSVSKHTSILKVCKVKCLIFNDLVTLRTFGLMDSRLCFDQLRYFVGIAAKVAFKNSQNFLTDSMFTFSSGECGELMVGPKETISHFG